jgi:hypothetical protein
MASEQDSDTSSSDDDTLQPELSDADMKSILTLEQALKQDPKAYDTHVQVFHTFLPFTDLYIFVYMSCAHL